MKSVSRWESKAQKKLHRKRLFDLLQRDKNGWGEINGFQSKPNPAINPQSDLQSSPKLFKQSLRRKRSIKEVGDWSISDKGGVELTDYEPFSSTARLILDAH